MMRSMLTILLTSAHSSQLYRHIYHMWTHALDALAWSVFLETLCKKSSDLRIADRATPFSDTLGKISPRWGNPFAATVACLIVTTALGLIYLGSAVAFNAFVGSFIILSSASYLAAILPHLLSKRKNIEFGPFKMPDTVAAILMPVACAYIACFIIIFCFPFS
jgi:hypothetical protein